MDKDTGMEWLKEGFEKGRDEFMKLARISKTRIEIATLKKRREEKLKTLGRKVLELVEQGQMEAEPFEPEYGMILSIDGDIAEKEQALARDGSTPDDEDPVTYDD